MKSIRRTSFYICMSIFVAFLGAVAAMKWPELSHFLAAKKAGAPAAGADPFAYDPPLPSRVKDLHAFYRLNAELLPQEAAIRGSVTVQFDNPGTPDIRLYAYDYPFSPMTIRAVRWKGGELPFAKAGRVVTLPNEFKEKRAELTVEFVSSVPRAGTRFGVQDDVWTLTNWYPMLGALDRQNHWYALPQPVGYGDPFVYHYADYDVTFTSPAGYQWVSSWGRGEAQTRPDGRQELRFHAEQILSFALVGSPLFHVESVQVTPALTADIAAVSADNVKRIKEMAVPVLKTYTELYGDLPYPYVAIAETSRTDPLEYANMAIFGRELYQDRQVDHWLPHEIAHLWWYNSVNTVEPIFGWIDEGLVEASVAYYRERQYGPSAGQDVWAGYQADRERLGKAYPGGKLGMRLEQFDNYYQFHWTWYSSGALLYENLRRTIGDDAYFRFLKQVQTSYHGTAIGPEHLDQALSRVLNGRARYFVPNLLRPNREPFVPLSVAYYVETVIDGVPFYPAAPARLLDGTVYVPLREVAERLGWQVAWDKAGTIRLTRGGDRVTVTEGAAEAKAGAKAIALSGRVLEIDGRAMVPLAFFERVLGCGVDYDAAARSAHITKQK